MKPATNFSGAFPPVLHAAMVAGFMALWGVPQAFADDFVVKNMRDAGANNIRIAAASGTKVSQTIVLLGGNKEVWPKIRDAARDAERQGCRVRGILIGPVDETPSLEIYAQLDGTALQVTKPINPYEIGQAELTKLICDVDKEFYKKK